MNNWKEKALEKLRSAGVKVFPVKKKKLTDKQRESIIARANRKRHEITERCGWMKRGIRNV